MKVTVLQENLAHGLGVVLRGFAALILPVLSNVLIVG